MTSDNLRTALSALPQAALWRLVGLEETPSVMQVLRQPDLLAAPEPLVLATAEFQTAGRGQRGSSWESEQGKNLTFGFSFKPRFLAPEQQFSICQIASLAVAEALDAYVAGVSIKWPNDIYVGQRKICGMLIEHDLAGGHISRTLVGPGVNINQARFVSDAPNPISLRQLLGHDVSRADVLARIMTHFTRHYARLRQDGPEAIDEAYHRRLYRRDGRLHAFAAGAERFEARLEGAERDGRLRLRLPDGSVRRFAFKEISYVL